MIFSKKCPRCKGKLSRKYSFCPYCGKDLRTEKDEKDYGMLGKDDFLDEKMDRGFGFGIKMPPMFDNLVRMLDKQLRELDKEFGQDFRKGAVIRKKVGEEKQKEISREKFQERQGFPVFRQAGGISISISTGTGRKPEIRVRRFGDLPEFKQVEQEIRQRAGEPRLKLQKPEISEEKAKKIASLPREEAVTNVRRLGNRVIYEIDLPGVKNREDVIVNQLENSIEIKAFSEDKVFFKLIPVKLPLMRYGLRDGKLILELEAG